MTDSTTRTLNNGSNHISVRSLSLSYSHKAPESLHSPLVILVHGRAGNKDVMWAFRRCIPDSFGVVLPEAPYDDPFDGGKSWWIIDSPTANEQRSQSLVTLSRFISEYCQSNQLQPHSVIVAGFSQGGAMASLLLQSGTIPDLHGVALLASFAIEHSTEPIESAPEVFLAHGDDDLVVPIKSAHRSQAFFESLGCEVLLVTDPVGHKVGREGMKALTEWFRSFS